MWEVTDTNELTYAKNTLKAEVITAARQYTHACEERKNEGENEQRKSWTRQRRRKKFPLIMKIVENAVEAVNEVRT